MLESVGRIAIIAAAGVLWFTGLRLLLQSDLSRTRKIGWTVFLVVIGIAIGVVLPASEVWRKFWLLVLLLPVLGLADVWLLRSGRGVSFWIRACGFEVGTVFGAAAVTRVLMDLVRAAGR